MSLNAGQVLENRYQIEALLGKGGMGAVYKAWDTRLDKHVAVKENLDASEQAQRQFLREAKLLARLDHPNLPGVSDHFFIPQQGQYLVMDFIEGQDLRQSVSKDGSLPDEKQVIAWFVQVCEALAYLHGQTPPVIHRDIKPANIKVRPDGRVILVDFGISKSFSPESATTLGARAVTPGFSPPEQYGNGQTDERSDIYSLGATLYTIFTGQLPPESVDLVASEQALPSVKQLNPSISPALAWAIFRCTELNKSRRFQTVAELRSALLNPPGVAPQPAPQEQHVESLPLTALSSWANDLPLTSATAAGSPAQARLLNTSSLSIAAPSFGQRVEEYLKSWILCRPEIATQRMDFWNSAAIALSVGLVMVFLANSLPRFLDQYPAGFFDSGWLVSTIFWTLALVVFVITRRGSALFLVMLSANAYSIAVPLSSVTPVADFLPEGIDQQLLLDTFILASFVSLVLSYLWSRTASIAGLVLAPLLYGLLSAILGWNAEGGSQPLPVYVWESLISQAPEILFTSLVSAVLAVFVARKGGRW